jgi:diguanylate cyclase (GGDEF)-like protein
MLKWLLSRPLQIKFFICTILLVSVGLLVLMLSVMQMLNHFLTQHIKDDLQQRTHILAMTLMVGPAAHNTNDLRDLLEDVSKMHGYCYLSVHDTGGKMLASAGNDTSRKIPVSDMNLDEDRNGCFDGSIELIHDGKPFGTLYYGGNIGFVQELKNNLSGKLIIVSMLWLVIGASMYFFLVRRLVKPLQTITRASESMAHGNLNSAMPRDLPQDELGKLATSFCNMATALRERVESQQSYAHALYAEQARLNALVSILPVGIMFVDPSRQVQYINLECRRLWGLPEGEDYIGEHDAALIARARNLLEQPEAFVQQVEAVIKEYGISIPFDTLLRKGKVIRSRSCAVPDATGERYIGRIWMFEDVTEEHDRLHEAQARAERDALTGLYNRLRFEEDLGKMFAQAQRDKRRLTLLYFDLDDFKNINDNYGHPSGDKVLKAVAQALTLQSRRNESLYRLGGDEFAILIADADLHQIEILAQRVISSVEQLLFYFGEVEAHIRCSMGIAAYSPEGPPQSVMELMQQADIAMYQAKHSGKNRWHIFDHAHPLDLDNDSR